VTVIDQLDKPEEGRRSSFALDYHRGRRFSTLSVFRATRKVQIDG